MIGLAPCVKPVSGSMQNCITLVSIVIAPTAMSPPYFRREELKLRNRTLSVICMTNGDTPSAIELPRILKSGRRFEIRSLSMVFLPHRKRTTQKADTNCEIMVYEPLLFDTDFDRTGFVLVDDLNVFKSKAGIILANRYDDCLRDVKEKIYTRDIFGCL